MSDYKAVDYEFPDGYKIKEGTVVPARTYEYMVGETKPDKQPDEDDPYWGIPDTTDSFHSTKQYIVLRDGDTVDTIPIIVFNRKDNDILNEKKPGTEFLFLPFSEKFGGNKVIRGKFESDNTVLRMKNEQERLFDSIKEVLGTLSKAIIGRRVHLYFHEPCSVEGREGRFEKIGIVSKTSVEFEYNCFVFKVIFDDDYLETYIDTEITYSHEDNMYNISYANFSGARTLLAINILEEEITNENVSWLRRARRVSCNTSS